MAETGQPAVPQPLRQQDLPPATGVDAVTTEHEGVQPAEHHEPNVLGFDATFLVALSMAVLIGVILWRRVPRLITASLDNRIAAIRDQLDEARAVRTEAEGLRDRYNARLAGLEAEAAAMRAAADAEAREIVSKAKSDTDALIERRRRMAEDRIAAAERQSIADVRASAAEMSTATAAHLLAARMDVASDQPLQDRAIESLRSVR